MFSVSLPQFQDLWQNQHGDCFIVVTTCQKYKLMSKIQPVPTQIIEIENVQWCIIKPIANLYICGVCPFPKTRQFIQLLYFFLR